VDVCRQDVGSGLGGVDLGWVPLGIDPALGIEQVAHRRDVGGSPRGGEDHDEPKRGR
jgi:hypothetical protein